MKLFEKYIRLHLLGHQTDLDTEDLWAKIEKERRRRRIVLWWKWTGASLFLLLSSALLFTQYKQNNDKSISSNTKNIQNINNYNSNTYEKTNQKSIEKNIKENIEKSISQENTLQSQNLEKSSKKNTLTNNQNSIFINKNNQNASIIDIKNIEKTFLANTPNTSKKGIFSDENNNATSQNIQASEATQSGILTAANTEKNLNEDLEKTNTKSILPKENISILADLEKLKMPLSLQSTEETNKPNFENLPLFSLKNNVVKSKKTTLFIGLGAGVPQSIALINNDLGDVKNIEFWQTSLHLQRAIKDKKYFVQAGIGANRNINLLTWQKNTSTTLNYLDSLKYIGFNAAIGTYGVLKDTFKVIRTTERNVRQYQYRNNFYASIGIGKQSQCRIFKYQYGVEMLLSYQTLQGKKLDNEGKLQALPQPTAFRLGFSGFAQIGYPLRQSTIWLRASQQQWLNDKQLNRPIGEVAWSRRF